MVKFKRQPLKYTHSDCIFPHRSTSPLQVLLIAVIRMGKFKRQSKLKLSLTQ